MRSKKRIITSLNANIYLFQFMELLGKYQQKIDAEAGLTAPQLIVMAAIKYLPSPVYTTDISKWTNKSMNATNATLNIMVREGLAKRTRSLKDRRNVRLTLTPKGVKLLENSKMSIKDIPIEVMSILTDDELKSLISMTQKLIKYLLPILDFDGSLPKLDSYHRADLLQKLLKQENINYSIDEVYRFLSSPQANDTKKTS